MHNPLGYNLTASLFVGMALSIFGYLAAGLYDKVVVTGIANFSIAVASIVLIASVGTGYVKDIKQDDK